MADRHLVAQAAADQLYFGTGVRSPPLTQQSQYKAPP